MKNGHKLYIVGFTGEYLLLTIRLIFFFHLENLTTTSHFGIACDTFNGIDSLTMLKKKKCYNMRKNCDLNEIIVYNIIKWYILSHFKTFCFSVYILFIELTIQQFCGRF